MLSQYLPYEGTNHNAINPALSITAIILYPRLSAVPQKQSEINNKRNMKTERMMPIDINSEEQPHQSDNLNA